MYLHQTFLRWKCNLLKEVLHNVNTFYGENLWRNLEITVIPTKKTIPKVVPVESIEIRTRLGIELDRVVPNVNMS